MAVSTLLAEVVTDEGTTILSIFSSQTTIGTLNRNSLVCFCSIRTASCSSAKAVLLKEDEVANVDETSSCLLQLNEPTRKARSSTPVTTV